MVRSRLKTSTAKIMAAMGDWKTEAMAPAEAQAMSNERVFALICRKRDRFELRAAPEATAGPKSPTDPPNPTVRGAVIKGV